MVRIRFVQANGDAQEIDAMIGDTLMANAKAKGVDGIIAECDGCMVCGTCHVYIAGSWSDRIDPPSQMETEMLDCGLHREANSRLSCQIKVTGEMDGLEVGIPVAQR